MPAFFLIFRQVTFFEELLLLKEFEKRENVLAAKVESKQQEKLDMQGKVRMCPIFCSLFELQTLLLGKKTNYG